MSKGEQKLRITRIARIERGLPAGREKVNSFVFDVAGNFLAAGCVDNNHFNHFQIGCVRFHFPYAAFQYTTLLLALYIL